MHARCIKSLYKSTYKGWAFRAGKVYKVTKIDEYYWIEDEKGKEFSFDLMGNHPDMYQFYEYFQDLH